MIIPQRTPLGDWLIEYLSEQIKARTMTRNEAIAHIKASLERVKQAGPESASEAERIAAAMIAVLPRGPDHIGDG